MRWIDHLYLAASTIRKKPKKWIQKAKFKKGAFRDMLGLPPGEPIPDWIKNEGCFNPKKTYYKWFKEIPHHDVERLFQKRACAARNLRGLKRKKTRKAA